MTLYSLVLFIHVTGVLSLSLCGASKFCRYFI